MKLVFINGSPKNKGSNTENFIKCLLPFMPPCETEMLYINNDCLTEDEYIKISRCDVLIFAFPLYVDSLPSHLLKVLVLLEDKGFENKDIAVYCIINNGFFEGAQNRIACSIMKNWCNAVGLKWGMAVGIGAGEMSPSVMNAPLDKGPFRPLSFAFNSLVQTINHRSTADNIFVSPMFPRFLWRIAANCTFWLPKAKANGLKGKDIFRSASSLK